MPVHGAGEPAFVAHRAREDDPRREAQAAVEKPPEGAAHEAVDAGDAAIAVARPHPAVEHDEARDAVGVEGEGEGDGAAEVVYDEGDVAEVEGFDEGAQAARVVGGCEPRAGGGVGEAEVEVIGRDDAVVGGEPFDDAAPLKRPARRAVNEQHRRAGALVEVRQRPIGGGEALRGEGVQRAVEPRGRRGSGDERRDGGGLHGHSSGVGMLAT